MRLCLSRGAKVVAVVSLIAMSSPARAGTASPAITCSGSWTAMGSPSPAGGGELLGVWAASATDVWAVGDNWVKTLVEHRTSSGWHIVSAPVPGIQSSLHDVSGNSASNVWAVGDYSYATGGDRMLTLHWNGSTWSRFSTPSLSGGPRLEGVSVGRNRPTWAVGYHAVYLASQWGTVILRRVNGKWVHVASPNPNPYSNELYAVQSVSPSLAWAVGFSKDSDLTYHPLVERWNGTKWTAITDPAVVGLDGLLSDVMAPTPTTVLAVGWGNAGGPMVLSFDGATWSVAYPGPVSGNFARVSADGAGGAWIVGRDDPSDSEEDTLVEQGSGTEFARVASPNPAGTTNALQAVATRSGISWAVGFKDGGTGTLIEYQC